MPAKDPHAVALGRKAGKTRTLAKAEAGRKNIAKATAVALAARPCYGILDGMIYRFPSPAARSAAGADPILARDPRVTKGQRRGEVRVY